MIKGDPVPAMSPVLLKMSSSSSDVSSILRKISDAAMGLRGCSAKAIEIGADVFVSAVNG